MSGRDLWTRKVQDLGSNPSLSTITYEAVGKLFNISVSQFPYPSNSYYSLKAFLLCLGYFSSSTFAIYLTGSSQQPNKLGIISNSILQMTKVRH